MPAPIGADLIDAVDSRNEPVGVVARADVLEHGANFRTVHLLLTDRRGRVLLQRLASSRRRFPGRLGSSVAGYLHRGESFEVAARRRVREELGIRPALALLGVSEIPEGDATKFVGVFRGSGEGATIQDDSHVGELVWWSPSEIDEQLSRRPALFTPTFAEVWAFATRRPD